MTGYTSGKINHDAEPWVWEDRHVHIRYADYQDGPVGAELSHAPRPEFDHHNPILVAFRTAAKHQRGGGRSVTWLAQQWASGPDDLGPDIPHEHIDHARRVLAKLAALTTTPNGVTD